MRYTSIIRSTAAPAAYIQTKFLAVLVSQPTKYPVARRAARGLRLDEDISHHKLALPVYYSILFCRV